jgi:hypothetical protein
MEFLIGNQMTDDIKQPTDTDNDVVVYLNAFGGYVVKGWGGSVYIISNDLKKVKDEYTYWSTSYLMGTKEIINKEEIDRVIATLAAHKLLGLLK